MQSHKRYMNWPWFLCILNLCNAHLIVVSTIFCKGGIPPFKLLPAPSSGGLSALLNEWFRCLLTGKDWDGIFLLCCSEGGRTALSEINWRKEDVGFQGWAGRLADGVLQIPALCFQLSLLGKEASCCHKTLLAILLRQGSLTSTLFLNLNLSQSVWQSYQYAPIKGHRLECWSLKVWYKVGYYFIVEGRGRRCVLQVCFSSLL